MFELMVSGLTFSIIAGITGSAVYSVFVMAVSWNIEESVMLRKSRFQYTRTMLVMFLGIWAYLLFPTFLFFLFLRFASFSLHLIVPVYDHIVSNEWATGPLLLLAALLYRLRGTNRFLYGICEVVIGILAIWASLHIVGPELDLGIGFLREKEAGVLLGKSLAIFSGIYVIIRGLDNIDNDLPRGMRPKWDEFFPKRKRT